MKLAEIVEAVMGSSPPSAEPFPGTEDEWDAITSAAVARAQQQQNTSDSVARRYQKYFEGAARQQRKQQAQGPVPMGKGGAAQMLGSFGTGSTPNLVPGGFTKVPSISEPPVPKVPVRQAVAADLGKQGATDIDAARLVRVTLRAIRTLDDRVLEAAGLNPQRDGPRFTKLIDQLLQGA